MLEQLATGNRSPGIAHPDGPIARDTRLTGTHTRRRARTADPENATPACLDVSTQETRRRPYRPFLVPL